MRLDTWLEIKGVSQADLAKRIGASYATVSRIVGGQQNIPLSIADAIVRETKGEVTLDDLHGAWTEANRESAA